MRNLIIACVAALLLVPAAAQASKATKHKTLVNLYQKIDRLKKLNNQLEDNLQAVQAQIDQLGGGSVAGKDGINGMVGPSGTDGVPGRDGSAGVDGTRGDAGPMGTTGSSGSNGAIGPQGPAGPQGSTGATGPTGANAVLPPTFSRVALQAPSIVTATGSSSATATCPAGRVVTGGGVSGTGSAAARTSYPSSATAWTGSLASGVATVYALCSPTLSFTSF
jgi:hypothetical protein